MKWRQYNIGGIVYIRPCVDVLSLPVSVDTTLMNKHRKELFGTLPLPVCRRELLDGLGEGLEGTELGMTFEVVSWRSASGKDHSVVLVPHSDICRKSDVIPA